ncbi:hypothetical protein [Nocardia camponoti]|uniref:Uncharacterized protein n=1 Tax=Nocardia camponoti TaxID=1616106 RepID=A0A917QDV7_9NOCA|nr:hypothetical protein [Nocardia camponoti]GGK44303.1 hypothetical protein GCM10011591_14790 [Nocardia camponoti]
MSHHTPPASDNAADVVMPWAPRDHRWSGEQARHDARIWADGDPIKLASIFIYRREGGNPAAIDDYKFPIADIIDGRPTKVFHAVSAAAGDLDKAHISDHDREIVKRRITELYLEAGKAFGDPGLRAPWDR